MSSLVNLSNLIRSCSFTIDYLVACLLLVISYTCCEELPYTESDSTLKWTSSDLNWYSAKLKHADTVYTKSAKETCIKDRGRHRKEFREKAHPPGGGSWFQRRSTYSRLSLEYDTERAGGRKENLSEKTKVQFGWNLFTGPHSDKTDYLSIPPGETSAKLPGFICLYLIFCPFFFHLWIPVGLKVIQSRRIYIKDNLPSLLFYS